MRRRTLTLFLGRRLRRSLRLTRWRQPWLPVSCRSLGGRRGRLLWAARCLAAGTALGVGVEVPPFPVFSESPHGAHQRPHRGRWVGPSSLGRARSSLGAG